MPEPSLKPNLFELTGERIQLTYAPTSDFGQPYLRYNTHSFTGNELHTL